jgi:hypothetical protein
MPNAELVVANSMLELRFSPDRLTGEIAAFLDRVWDPPQADARSGAARGAGVARRGKASGPDQRPRTPRSADGTA